MSASWEHQVRGAALIRSRRAVGLDWEMGTGKTRAVLDSIEMIRPSSVLILAPLAVCPVWPAQVALHKPAMASGYTMFDASAATGSCARKALAIRHVMRSARHMVVCHYDIVWRPDILDALLSGKWDMLILDESHRVKSPSAKATRAVRRIARATEPHGRRICLTGTMMPHSPADAWAQTSIIAPDAIHRTFAEFRGEHAIMGGFSSPVTGRPVSIVGWRDMEGLSRRLGKVWDRVRADDVMDLPEAVHSDIVVDLPAPARRAYESMRKELVAEIEGGIVTAANGAVRLMRLQQIAAGSVHDESGTVRVVHGAKESALRSLLEDIPPGEPVVVFCRFRASLDAVSRAAAASGRPLDEISGSRKTFHARWEPAGGAVAAIQIQAGGLGIDLTAARRAVWMEHPLSLGDYEQCLARIRRAGQKARSVHYVHIITRSTVDAGIRQAIGRKADIVASCLDLLAKGK